MSVQVLSSGENVFINDPTSQNHATAYYKESLRISIGQFAAVIKCVPSIYIYALMCQFLCRRQQQNFSLWEKHEHGHNRIKSL